MGQRSTTAQPIAETLLYKLKNWCCDCVYAQVQKPLFLVHGEFNFQCTQLNPNKKWTSVLVKFMNRVGMSINLIRILYEKNTRDQCCSSLRIIMKQNLWIISKGNQRIMLKMLENFWGVTLPPCQIQKFYGMNSSSSRIPSLLCHSRAAMTPSTTSWVVLCPPRSFVLHLPSNMTRATAVSSRSAKEGNCRCLNIMADERSRATGFAFFLSNIFWFPTFPAEAPCSKIAWSAPTLPAGKTPEPSLLISNKKHIVQKWIRFLFTYNFSFERGIADSIIKKTVNGI